MLSPHLEMKYLRFRSSQWVAPLVLPPYRNLKQLEFDKSSGYVCDRTLMTTIRNNPGIESLIFSHCNEIISIYSIATHLKQLKELNLICSMHQDWRMLNGSLDFIANSLKYVESLRLTIDGDIRLLHHLASVCENLKQLELNYTDLHHFINYSLVVIDAASRFRTIERLDLSQLKNFDSIRILMQFLPNLHHLRELNLFIETPQETNTFLPSLSRKCPSLKSITITSWNDADLYWPVFLLNPAIFKESIKSIWEPSCYLQLKQFRREFGFATKKEIVWCGQQSCWIVNDSTIFSARLLMFFLFIFILIVVCFCLGVSIYTLNILGMNWAAIELNYSCIVIIFVPLSLQLIQNFYLS